MAKCIGSTTDWTTKVAGRADGDTISALSDDTVKGEDFLRLQLDGVTQTILDIASDFILIRLTVNSDSTKINCTEVRDSLMTRLKELNSETSSMANKICSSKLISSTKHRYYILYSCGVISKLQQLLQITGRLSELEQKIYLDEHQNPFISDESMTIHALTSIWAASVNMMNNFREPGRAIFQEEPADSQDYNFVEHMEFSTSGYQYAKVFIMDLLITSWIQFNRLVKFDDLVRGLPFLCPCHCKTFFSIVKLFDLDQQHKILTELLPLIVDYQSKPSLMTESVRQCNVVPLEPCYSLCDQQNLAYFVVWNLYALSRIVKPADKPMLENCKELLEASYSIAMKQFEAVIEQPNFRLSPHQEERHKLISHMKLTLGEL